MDSEKDWHTTNLSSFNKGQILHLAQGSLYVRDELSYVFAGIVPFYIHFPQRSVTKIDIMSKGVPHLQISVNLLVPVKKARKTGGVFGGQNLKNEEKLKKKFQKFLLSQIVR